MNGKYAVTDLAAHTRDVGLGECDVDELGVSIETPRRRCPPPKKKKKEKEKEMEVKYLLL